MPRWEDCSLRPLRQEDLRRVLRWRNSDRVRASVFNDRVISFEEHRDWFHRIQINRETVVLVFECGAVSLGVVSFTHIDPNNGKAFWGFYIGEEGQPPGMGSAMGYLGIRYGFEGLQLRKIVGQVLCSNPRSIALHHKLGFIEEGHFRDDVLKNGVYEDVLSFALLAKDWRRDQSMLLQLIFSSEQDRSHL